MMGKFRGPVSPAGVQGAGRRVRGQHAPEPALAVRHLSATSLTGKFGTSLYVIPAIGRPARARQRDLVDARPGRHHHGPRVRARHRCIGIVAAWRRGGAARQRRSRRSFVITVRVPVLLARADADPGLHDPTRLAPSQRAATTSPRHARRGRRTFVGRRAATTRILPGRHAS